MSLDELVRVCKNSLYFTPGSRRDEDDDYIRP